MKKVEYSCNLCLEKKNPLELFCMRWGFPEPAKQPTKQKYHLVDNLDCSDMHICDDCIEEIKIFKKP